MEENSFLDTNIKNTAHVGNVELTHLSPQQQSPMTSVRSNKIEKDPLKPLHKTYLNWQFKPSSTMQQKWKIPR